MDAPSETTAAQTTANAGAMAAAHFIVPFSIHRSESGGCFPKVDYDGAEIERSEPGQAAWSAREPLTEALTDEREDENTAWGRYRKDIERLETATQSWDIATTIANGDEASTRIANAIYHGFINRSKQQKEADKFGTELPFDLPEATQTCPNFEEALSSAFLSGFRTVARNHSGVEGNTQVSFGVRYVPVPATPVVGSAPTNANHANDKDGDTERRESVNSLWEEKMTLPEQASETSR